MANIPSRVSAEVAQKFTLQRNTFSRVVKDNPKDKVEVIIGDDKQDDFKPQWKFMRWGNEINFSIRAEEDPSAEVRTQADKIKYVTPNYEVHMYEQNDLGEDGGFIFEWVFEQKPPTNVVRATLNTKELDLFYQPPLTQEEILEGAERPDNVVGSYAAYHKSKGGLNRIDGMEYKTGKAFHLYRMKATDADGKEVWCDFNTDLNQTGVLEVTIPQGFLDNAVYPVKVT